MIAAIEWIPAGRANPTPTKYEYSREEKELLARLQAGEIIDGANNDAGTCGDKTNTSDDEEWEDVEDEKEESGKTQHTKVKLPKVDPSSLPADLRMDEYDDGDQETVIGGLLVGQVRRVYCYACQCRLNQLPTPMSLL